MKHVCPIVAVFALWSTICVRPSWAADPMDSIPQGIRDLSDENIQAILSTLKRKSSSSASSGSNANDQKGYIVQMDDMPVIAYQGGKPGLPATKPAKGQKLNPNDAKVIKYQGFLKNKHASALTGAGLNPNKKIADYTVCLDGFSAKLTQSEVTALQKVPGVLSVTESTKHTMDTITTPDFLGLTSPGGPWSLGYKGEDVIIGIIDTGAWPENPGFTDRTGTNKQGVRGKLDYRQIQGWHGKCVPGQNFTAANCNQKLIGAQYYYAGFEDVLQLFPYEFKSPRAADGHGVHVAGTAGGNENVPTEIGGIQLGAVSGMAPRARIASYKTCWGNDEDDAGCFDVDTVAAIDQAVLDGVDVINFSISGTRTNFLDPVEVAFLFAAEAGVFVAASAGNSGPESKTVAHPSPWITTVAAGTHSRLFEATVTLGNDATYTGASIQDTGTGVLDLVYSSDVGLSGQDPDEVRLCYIGTLDPALVSGKMVLCDRGTIARVAKSAAVQAAGGAAMILGNTAENSLDAEIHSVPTIHVQNDVRDNIFTYIQSNGNPTASLSPFQTLVDPTAPRVAAFSSRGPTLASSGILKPDIMAPGVGIIAAVSPVFDGNNFASYSGTLMSSPHIAGLAAVIKSAHPNWTPMMIKSALMTSSDDTVASPFEEGSGHVNPSGALDPGLVYDSGYLDWLGFLCGTKQLQASYCTSLEIDPSNLNTPNIALDLAGLKTVTRTVTNVGPAGTYTANLVSPAGIDVLVTPSTLTLEQGQSASYQVDFQSTADADLNQYAFGTLIWRDGVHEVRSVLAVRPLLLDAPGAINGAGSSGVLSFGVGFGTSGTYTPAPHGLESPDINDGNVLDDPTNDIDTALNTDVGVTLHVITVPAGTEVARFSLFDKYTDGNDDLDLYVFGPTFNFVGASGSSTSNEEVILVSPAAGTHYVIVHGYATEGPDANYKLFSWMVSGTPNAGDFPLVIDSAPASAIVGESGTVSVSWDVSSDPSTLGRIYFGAVSHMIAGSLAKITVVGVNDDD